jgi:hypothetical protein
MRKNYPLHVEGRHPDRVLDAIKHDVRKYLKRERRRDLPEGVDYWDFDCKVGDSKDSAAVVHLSELIGRIDEVAKAQAVQVYVEVLATHGKRKPRPALAEGAVLIDDTDDDLLPE